MTTITVNAATIADHEPAASASRPATERQIDYARDLYRHIRGYLEALRDLGEADLDGVQTELDLLTSVARAAKGDMARMSRLLDAAINRRDELKRKYEAAVNRSDRATDTLTTAAVPEGRYALRDSDGVVRFYVVDHGRPGTKWENFVFLSAQASDELHPIRNAPLRDRVLGEILEAGLEESTVLYGTELGVCGRCGRTLTDEDSRAAGIGPVCAGKEW